MAAKVGCSFSAPGEYNSGELVEKEIERSNATASGDDKVGSRVSWWFAGGAGNPLDPSPVT